MIFDKIDSFMVFGVLLSQLIRWSVSRWPYSGAGKPPMYGDYEAHRHWMEITVNLPVEEWYRNSSVNDLDYWGLDYPPLSAYQSWICGYFAWLYDPEWIALKTSRGHESYDHKLFMRTTVVLFDAFFLTLPAIVYWTLIKYPKKPRDKAIAASLFLLYPGFILIDHGHFQYNNFCLGLAYQAVMGAMLGWDIVMAFFYTLSIHTKQMALYYAFPFFFYLLGSCFQLPKKDGLLKFAKLAAIVIATSAICWAPFLSSFETFSQVVSRLFPIKRGLYEDKVANVWCSLSVFIKLKALFSTATLVKLSALTTFLWSLPSSVHVFRKPAFHTLLLSLVNCSLVFFLFSYQVHEKSILFVALPVLLLIESHPMVCCWFSYISTFSLVPLLAKDGLIIPYISLTTMFLTGVLRAYDGLALSLSNKEARLKTIAFWSSILLSVCLIIAMYAVKPPKRYPDLHVLINCVYSCVHFVGFAVYFHWVQFTERQAKSKRE